MKTKILITVSLISHILTAQNGQKKPLSDFNQIQIDVNTTVKLKKSDTPYIITSDSLSGITFDVKDEKLTVLSDKNKKEEGTVIIGYVTLNTLSVYGVSTVKSDDIITTDKLQVNATGAVKCKLEIEAGSAKCLVMGASSLTLRGTCTKLDASVGGAANFKAEELITENASVNTTGAATAKVNVTNRLEGSASGASTLRYTGAPKETQINQSGASSVKNSDVVISAESNGSTDITTTTSNGDSIKRYTFNGRYEIIVHEKKQDDTSTVYYKKRHYGIRKQNWAGVDLFENGYLTPGNNISLPPSQDYLTLNYGIRNMGCNLNLFEKDFRIAKGKLQFVTGLGFSWNSYNLKNKTVLKPDSSYTGYSYNTAVSFSKNKLKESFITVPLLFEMNTSKRDSRNFHIAFGVIGGAKLGSGSKQIYNMGGHEFRDIKRDDYNLYPFKLDATVRVGYGDFTMFATYSLTPLFEFGKGPELYPFTVGIRIVPF